MNGRYLTWYTPWLSINHWFDDGKWRGHDWNYRQDMLPYHLSLL